MIYGHAQTTHCIRTGTIYESKVCPKYGMIFNRDVQGEAMSY